MTQIDADAVVEAVVPTACKSTGPWHKGLYNSRTPSDMPLLLRQSACPSHLRPSASICGLLYYPIEVKLSEQSLPIVSTREQARAEPRAIEQVDRATGLKNIPSRLVSKSWERKCAVSTISRLNSASIGISTIRVSRGGALRRSRHPSRNCSTVTRRTHKGSGKWQ